MGNIDELYETYLKNPYWIFDSDFEKQYYAKFNVKATLLNSATKVLDIGFTNAFPIAFINSTLVYGVNRLIDYAEDEHSKYIVRLYLVATLSFEANGNKSDVVSIIEKVGFDLLGMSALRYLEKAEGIKSTIFEDLLGKHTAYLERQDKYITGKVKNRILAYMFNVSMIFNLWNNEKFKKLWDNYTSFEWLSRLKSIEVPSKSKHIIRQIRCLTDYESGRFRETLNKRYQFRDSIRDEYASLGTDEIYKELAQNIVNDLY